MKIHYGEPVRFRTPGSRYLTAAGQGDPWFLSDTNEKMATNLFTLHEKDHDRRDKIRFSGNLGADTLNAQGNFRIQRTEAPKEEMMIASVDFHHVTPGYDCLFSGTTWGNAQDFETFTFFDPHNMHNTGYIEEMTPVHVQNMRGSDQDSVVMWFKDHKDQIKTFFETMARDPKRGAPGDQVGHLWDTARSDDKNSNAARMLLRTFLALTPRWNQTVAGCFDNGAAPAVFYIERG